MKKLKGNQNFTVLFTENLFKIYKTSSCVLLKEINAENAYIFNISSGNLFYANSDALISINLSNFEKTEIASPAKKISTIFNKDSFLYVGHESGLINIYAFNDHIFKLSSCYVHSGPVTSLASDGSKIYVTDYRNKVTVFPENKSFDFTEPRLYFSKYVFCSSENNLFARTKDAFGFLFTIKENIEHIEFSNKGGLIFIQTKRGTTCYDILGNERSHFLVSDFSLRTENGHCILLTGKEGNIEQTETYMRDIEMDEIVFSKVNIVEVAVEGDEYDQKRNLFPENKERLFVKEGKKKSLTKKKKVKLFNEDSEESINESSFTHEKRRSIRKFSESSEEDKTHAEPLTKLNGVTPNYKGGSIIASVEDSNLLFFNTDGYIISILSKISNTILIKFHDNYLEPLDFKDEDKCNLASFFGGKFLVSNGSTLNFNGEWKKKINSKMIGINKKYIFSAGGNLLAVFDYKGNLVYEILIKTFDGSIFAVGENSVALFTEEYLVYIDTGDNFEATYIPVFNASFACFCGDILYVGVGCYLFKMCNKMFHKVLEFKGTPLAVTEEYLITLSEPFQLLPNIGLVYNFIKREEVKTVDLEMDKSKRFNPYKI